MVRQIKVVKVRREDEILDKPAKFPKLDNLFLEYEEFKDKARTPIPKLENLKVNPDDLPRYRPDGKMMKDSSDETPEDEDEDDEDKDGGEFEEEDETEEIPHKKKNKNPNDDDDELVKDLGEDEEDEKGKTKEPETVEVVNKYDGMTPEEIEATKKDKYLYKLKMLRKKWPKRASEVPVFNKHDDLINIKTTYKSTVNDFLLDDKIGTYKMYLTAGFWAFEMIFSGFIGIDVAGFAQAQIKIMDKYERMLIELGEKDRNRWEINLPVEIKLIGFILLQVVLFWLAKKFGGTAVEDIFSTIMGVAGGGVQKEKTDEEKKQETQQKVDPKNVKMKGPSINLEALKKASEKNKKNDLETVD